MTREDAINELKYAKSMCEFDPITGELGCRNDEDKRQSEAFGTAIKALENKSALIDSEQDFRTGLHTVVLNRVIIDGKVYLAADKVLEILDQYYLWHYESSLGEYVTVGKEIEDKIRALKDGEYE